MALDLVPRWPAEWTVATAVLVAAVVGIALLRGHAAQASTTPPLSADQLWRQHLLRGFAHGAPAVLVALLVADASHGLGLGLGALLVHGGLLALALPLAVGGGWVAARRPGADSWRTGQFSSRTVLLVVVGTAVDRLGREALLRGVLLHTLADAAGAWPSVVITLALSTLLARGGALAALLAGAAGVVLAVASLEAGSFLGAFLAAWAYAATRGLAEVSARRR